MTRPLLLTLLVLASAGLAGCRSGATGEAIQPGVVHIGKDAAEVDQGRAHAFSEDIAALLRTREQLAKRRDQLLGDEVEYRRKAATVAQDVSLSATDRKLYAEQYLTLAADREKQAHRLHELMQAYDEQIRRLDSKRRARLHRSHGFGEIIVPEP